jgi:CheY-like chemotaxis protein
MGMKVLVVDDNPGYLRLVQDALRAGGYDVQTADDGIVACKMMTKSNVDLIISDIRMPLLDGVKLHSFTRELKRYKETKFVFLSSFKYTYEQALPHDPTVDFFLEKETPPDKLVQFVDKLMFGPFADTWL